MGKGSRAKQKKKRDSAKLKRKAAKKALYQSFAISGQNAKSKRFRKKARKVVTGKHPNGKCWNTGCMKCSPLFEPGGALHWQKLQHEAAQKTWEAQQVPKWKREAKIAA